MSILDKVIITTCAAPRITIYGKPGIGKSTLASTFPSPLFLLTEENGLEGINSLGPITSYERFMNIILKLLEVEEMPYKTIVIDSVSKMDSLVVDHIIDNEPIPKTGKKITTLASACGGYGQGYYEAQRLHRQLKMEMDKLRAKGITVIYISHLEVKKHQSPEFEDYDTYSIVMNNDKSRQIYIDDVDCVLFCKMKAYTSETESGRTLINSSGTRVVLTGCSEAHVSKNRFSMPDELPMSFEEISKYIPFYNKDKE